MKSWRSTEKKFFFLQNDSSSSISTPYRIAIYRRGREGFCKWNNVDEQRSDKGSYPRAWWSEIPATNWNSYIPRLFLTFSINCTVGCQDVTSPVFRFLSKNSSLFHTTSLFRTRIIWIFTKGFFFSSSFSSSFREKENWISYDLFWFGGDIVYLGCNKFLKKSWMIRSNDFIWNFDFDV